MIEEVGTVVMVEGQWAKFIPQRHSCSSCANIRGGYSHSPQQLSVCASSTMLWSLPSQQLLVQIPPSIKIIAGEQVVVGITEYDLIKAAALVYGLPLLTLISALVLGQWLQKTVHGTELITIAIGLCGLLAGLGLVWWYSHSSGNIFVGNRVTMLRRL